MNARKRTAARAKAKARSPRREDKPTKPLRNVAPDAVDFRDRIFTPDVDRAPPAELRPGKMSLHPVLNQTSTDACTGFALATVVHALLGRRDGRLARRVSPFMLYGMARHYDNLSGTRAGNGSSVRGALKGWFKHGVCRRAWSRSPNRRRHAIPTGGRQRAGRSAPTSASGDRSSIRSTR
jgi:hypothetical protein